MTVSPPLKRATLCGCLFFVYYGLKSVSVLSLVSIFHFFL